MKNKDLPFLVPPLLVMPILWISQHFSLPDAATGLLVGIALGLGILGLIRKKRRPT